MFPDQAVKVVDWFHPNCPWQPILFVGHSGIGKSAIARAAANRAGSLYVRLNATGMEPSDCIGLPQMKDGATHWMPPAILKSLESDKPSILNFDEINRVPTETRHVLMQALDERELGELRLGSGCQIILTANPDDPGYHVDESDIAFLRRCLIIPVEFSFEAFRTWSMNEYRSRTGKPISAKALSAMGRNKQAFVKEIKSMDKFQQIPTPDGVVRCSELEQLGIYEHFEVEEVIQIFSGLVGNAVATSIVKDLNDSELKKLKERLEKGEEVKVKHDMQIDLMYYVWQEWGAKPAENAKKIHHLFKCLDNDIKLILVRSCAPFFKKRDCKAAFMPMRQEWKTIMSEQMLHTKGIDPEEVKNLLNQLGQ